MYIPRMITPTSQVFVETGAAGQTRFESKTLTEIEQRVSQEKKAARKAA